MDVLCAGSFMVDVVATHLPYITPPGGLLYAPKGITVNVGGHAANVSIDLSQLGQTGVAAAGCIGDDMLGRYVLHRLTEANVEPKPQILSEVSTAKNIALTVEGEDRRFIAELAANTLLSPDHIISLLGENPRILYLGTIGGLRYIDRDLPRLLSAANDSGSLTFVDVIQPTERNWDHLKSALKHIDILHLNATEACQATGFREPPEAADALRSLGAETVVITNGSKGLTVLMRETRITMPAFNVEEVDSTGAGDALCAGLIHSLLSLKHPHKATIKDFKKALLEGQAAGAYCVTSPGATTAVTAEHVKKLMKEQGEWIKSSSISDSWNNGRKLG